MRPATLPVLAFACLAVLGLAACGGSSGSHPTVQIVQTDAGCTPDSLALSPGKTVTLQVRNDGTKDHEVEGMNGTKLSEVLVPAGHTRSVDFTPSSGDNQKIKCYIPGGSTTVIAVHTASTGATPAAANEQQGAPADAYRTSDTLHETVTVRLVEWSVTPDAPSISSGPVRFEAQNASGTMYHELVVLRAKDDGSYDSAGEVEDLAPGQSGNLTLKLPPGSYVLACQIAVGEQGSTVDHFQQGMHTAFVVR